MLEVEARRRFDVADKDVGWVWTTIAITISIRITITTTTTTTTTTMTTNTMTGGQVTLFRNILHWAVT